jgi:two-component system OmpR family response regulator
MRVLLVEDELTMARSLRRGLERHGYAVDLVYEGTEGLHEASRGVHDVIVLDLMLPGLDGFGLCSELRAKRVWTPVLMLTARDAVRDRVRGLDVGADDYLVKPFAFAEMLARIRALVRRGPVERPAVLTVGDIELDPGARRVTRGGQEVELSLREFSLLEVLMRHPGLALSRDHLLEHVWGQGGAHYSNVVDVYVGYLRRKLELAPDGPVIRAVRGVGYALEAS